METWEALTTRRQIREYTDEPVDAADLDRILEAGRISPSGHNSQPWHFVVIDNQDTISALAETWQGAAWITSAPVVIAVLGDRVEGQYMKLYVTYDLGQAVNCMTLVATDLGLATGQCGVMNQKLARSILGYPEEVICSQLVTVGHSSKPLRPLTKLNRRSFDDVVHRGAWGS
jgi:nitroreductase